MGVVLLQGWRSPNILNVPNTDEFLIYFSCIEPKDEIRLSYNGSSNGRMARNSEKRFSVSLLIL